MVAPSTPVVFSNVLANLGASADDVAAKLRARGIQGVRNTGRFLNPIVRYLVARQLLPLRRGACGINREKKRDHYQKLYLHR